MALDGPGGALIEPLAPDADDRFVVKPQYSAFDHTPLELILRGLDAERILLAGMATEMCVAQTAIGARERGFKVTVLADACACVDPENERIALAYLERVAGVFVESGSWAGLPLAACPPPSTTTPSRRS
jgi:nicotinamidase-related amidase